MNQDNERVNTAAWTSWRLAEDQRLYEQYGKPLEEEHTGKFVAIGPASQTILGHDDAEVLQQAIAQFASGNFAFTRVDDRTFGRL